MSFIRFSDMADEIIQETTKQLAPDYRLSDELKCKFDEVCEAIDEFVEDTIAEGFEVEVDESGDILVSVSTICLEADSENHSFFYGIMNRCKAFGFSRNEAGDLVISFRFPGVWRKVASHE